MFRKLLRTMRGPSLSHENDNLKERNACLEAEIEELTERVADASSVFIDWTRFRDATARHEDLIRERCRHKQEAAREAARYAAMAEKVGILGGSDAYLKSPEELKELRDEELSIISDWKMRQGNVDDE